MQVVDFATRVCYAASFPNRAIRSGFVLTGRGISLQHATEQHQMGLRMLALALRRIGKPYCWRRCIPGGSHLAHRLELAITLRKSYRSWQQSCYPGNGTLSRPAR